MTASGRHQGGGHFPTTRWSAFEHLHSASQEVRQRSFETIIGAYWKPVYKYVRFKWHKSFDDAGDVTQAFFTAAIEKDYFQGFDPAKGRFRTFLRVCVDRFVQKQNKKMGSLKRGAGYGFISFDFEAAERELGQVDDSGGLDQEAFFHREWVRELYRVSVEHLRATLSEAGKEKDFLVFEAYDLHEGDEARPSYQLLAERFDMSTTQVTNKLYAVRSRFRNAVLEKLRELTATEAEFRAEARFVLGVEAP